MAYALYRPGADALDVQFSDGQTLAFPWIWLRDNAPSAFHPQTQERTFDLSSLSGDAAPAETQVTGDGILVRWPDKTETELIPLAFLQTMGPGRRRGDPADIPAHSWDGSVDPASIPRYAAADLKPGSTQFLAWLKDTVRIGLSIIDGLPDETDAGCRLASSIGFLRQTNFGTTFSVESKPDPNNLAYTAVALPLHTDLANQEVPPGFQFLHCIANEAVGGGSTFADGFAAAAALQVEDPAAYRVLSETEIPFRFHDKDYDIRGRYPVIVTNRRGEVTELRFNAHLVDVVDLPLEQTVAFYPAYRKLMSMMRGTRFQISYRMTAGEMVVFDNRRVLHGRQAFDPSTGYRRLEGCYVDRGEMLSRIRVLSR